MMPDTPAPSRAADAIDVLLALMRRLRADDGCPWDRAQSFATIAPYTIEEAYEVADAIDRRDLGDLRDELGDLLFQVVFHARMAEEQRAFDFGDVARGITDKMMCRHPHVFGEAPAVDAAGMPERWEASKAEERLRRMPPGAAPRALDGIASGLPGLTRALKLQRRAARVGFDWTTAPPILDKIAEELAELRHEVEAGAPADRLEDELGDLLFATVNLARRLDIDPDAALRRTNAKFERRFRAMETALAEDGRRAEQCSLEELELLWAEAKRLEIPPP
jgi:ATP diphosphatase